MDTPDPRNPGGRPRIAPETVQVCVTLPLQQFDRLCAIASSARVSLPEAIRRSLAPTLSSKK